MYKFELFSFDWLNVILGYIQNGLGSILTINRIYQKIITYDETQTAEIYYDIGRIIQLVNDFEPIVVEEAGNPLYEDYDEKDDDLTY